MPDRQVLPVLQRRYREVFGAALRPSFNAYLRSGADPQGGAALGFRRACQERLFLEKYLDQPIESAVSTALGRMMGRAEVVEIGNFASDNAITMIALWALAANDLGDRSEVAVATLTAPLRAMFRRIGMPIHEIATARPDRLDRADGEWGRYYEQDPIVCAGIIAAGQEAIARFLSRRQGRKAA